uniref:FAM3 metabolism regulating signaling molecule D n=1 Tax=Molossus molossus TaxID=27622 RepID=A0A7J8DBA5_MOLMO|nr:FAM3 metabolism regulating signaling molecule D [Molossus molossus]
MHISAQHRLTCYRRVLVALCFAASAKATTEPRRFSPAQDESISYTSISMKNTRLPRWLGPVSKEIPVVKTKCGLSKSCPDNFFAFKISSGAANVVGPSICFEDHVIISPVKDNVGRGLNIALVNGVTGAVLRQDSFDMYSGDPSLLVKFLREIPADVLVLVASYDDPGTKMNDEIRKLFSNLGSSYAKQLGFRDSWVFLGARDMDNKSPFEQFLKNDPGKNKYDGWPELLELEGCVPRKVI